MTVESASKTQQLDLDNIGMTLLVRANGKFSRVTHASRFADTTDSILKQTNGFIAHVLTDPTNTVVATFIATEEEPFDVEAVEDFDRAGDDYTRLYVEIDNKLFQVAKIVYEDPDATDPEKAIDLAVMQGNAFMSLNQDTSLITATTKDNSKEIPRLYFISSNANAAS